MGWCSANRLGSKRGGFQNHAVRPRDETQGDGIRLATCDRTNAGVLGVVFQARFARNSGICHSFRLYCCRMPDMARYAAIDVLAAVICFRTVEVE